MRRALAGLACALLLAACAHATAADDDAFVAVALPRPPAAGERVVLEVETGTLGSGEELVLRTPEGQLIGTVSPHAIRPDTAAGTYPVPVPPALLAPGLLRGMQLRLRVTVERAHAPTRAARADEVVRIRAVLVPSMR